MRDSLIKNKKANLEDWGLQAWLVLSIILSVFFTNLILYKFNEKIQASASFGVDVKGIVSDATSKGINLLDIGVMLMYLVLSVLILYSAYFIKTNIKFAVVGFLYLFFTIWMIPLVSEIGIGILTANAITSVVADLMPRSYWIIENLTLLQAVMWLMVMIMLYAKSRNTTEQSGVSGSI